MHLLGGLGAIDIDSDTIAVGVGGLDPIVQFDRPPYPQLYSTLKKVGLNPVGVEFISHVGQMTGEMPSDWNIWQVDQGFKLRVSRREWSNIRHQAAMQNSSKLFDISSRISTYLELINIRLRHLSEAYQYTLRSALLDRRGAKVGIFSNLYQLEIEAAVHAFLADASSFRDILAEACWKLVLKRAEPTVTTMSAFIKNVKEPREPVAISMLIASSKGGWIKNLTDLRNNVTHAAPIGHTHEITACSLRRKNLTTGHNILQLHFALTNADWSIRKVNMAQLDFSTDEAAAKSFDAYQTFESNSGDALEYAWRTSSHLVHLAEQIRLAGNLKAPPPTITPIGPVQIFD